MNRLLSIVLVALAGLLIGSVLLDASARSETARVATEQRYVAAADVAVAELMSAHWAAADLPEEVPPRLGAETPWEERVQAARREQAMRATQHASALAEVVMSPSGPWLVQRTPSGGRRAILWRVAEERILVLTSGELSLDGVGLPLRWPLQGPNGPVTFQPAGAPSLQLSGYSDFLRTLLAALAVGAVLIGQVRSRVAQRERQSLMQRLSHDLRTPAASVRSLAAALRSDAVSESERTQFLELLDHEAARLAGGLDRMLRAARGEPLVVRKVAGDLADWAEQVQLRWLPRIPTLALEAPESLPWTFDRERMDEAIDALLDNAGKHGGPVVKVSVRRVAGHVELRVQDDGPGVSSAVRRRQWDRQGPGDSDGGPGHGLGIWAAREVAAAHGGGITLEGSSTFVLTLEES